MYYYRTYFKLLNPVKDLDDARNYLTQDDMTKHLKNNTNHCKTIDKDAIVSITWILQDVDSGYIELVATQEIDEKSLSEISNWISGQNSDGLGESFEQQDFAQYPHEDLGDYDDLDNYLMASFDWETNDYGLELYKVD